MNDKYNQFYNKVKGIPQEAEDPTNKDQCMDLIFVWCDFLGIDRASVRHDVAYKVWNQPNDLTRKYFDLIPNNPNDTNHPVTGDIVVFNTTVGKAGHVSICAPGTDGINLMSLDQNWGGAQYPRLISHARYSGVAGWLHPKGKNWDDIRQRMLNALNAGGTSQDRATNADKIYQQS